MNSRPLPLCRSLLLSLSLSLLLPITAAVASAATNATPRKNVLFLIADDLNNMLGAYGDPLARTPNLDKLAVRGVRFDRAYCTYPLCGPSRNSMLTGLYPNSNGIHGNNQIFRQTIPRQLSLSQAFRLQGYFAGRIGKLYHYNPPRIRRHLRLRRPRLLGTRPQPRRRRPHRGRTQNHHAHPRPVQ